MIHLDKTDSISFITGGYAELKGKHLYFGSRPFFERGANLTEDQFKAAFYYYLSSKDFTKDLKSLCDLLEEAVLLTPFTSDVIDIIYEIYKQPNIEE